MSSRQGGFFDGQAAPRRAWLPLTRELSPQATEGENSQPAPSEGNLRPPQGLAPLCKGSWQGRQALTEGLWVACRNGLPVPGRLLLHRAYNPSGSHSFATSPYTGEARGGRSAHPASQQARPISPSVKPFGLATSLVRGRQDGGRKQKGSDLSVRALAGAEGFEPSARGFGDRCSTS